MRRILLAAALLAACSDESVLGPTELQFAAADIPTRDSLPEMDVAASAGAVFVTGALPVNLCRFDAVPEGRRTASTLTLTIETVAKTPAGCTDEERAASFEAQLGDVDAGSFQVLVYWDAPSAAPVLVGTKTVQVP
jgi:hypothetical protein